MTKELIKKESSNIADKVLDKVIKFQNSGEIDLPKNYSPGNALKSAYLMLQTTLNKNKQPVLEACTQSSIANSLLDMVIQGLNPSKKQCYFIAYGNRLTCMRSYFGTEAVAKAYCNIEKISAQVVWGDDEFEYNIVNGVKEIITHKQKLCNIGKNPQGAYCILYFKHTENEKSYTYTDIMTMEQIKKSWEKSKSDPNSATGVHSNFNEEMIKKTVISRTCKPFINSSNDLILMRNKVGVEKNYDDESLDSTDIQDEIENNANQEFIDINPISSTDSSEVIVPSRNNIDATRQDNNNDQSPPF